MQKLIIQQPPIYQITLITLIPRTLQIMIAMAIRI
jgi:hypothetical protein